MDLFKVFFVILIAFTCQILAKPPINIVESSKTLDSEEINAFEEIEIELSQENEEPELEFSDPKIMDFEAMETEVAHEEEVKVNYSPINNVESSKTLDSEEISASEEIEIELSQENEEPELEFSDPKIMDLEAMEKEVAHDEEVKVNYSQSESPVITRYMQSPLIRTTARWPTLGVLKNSSNLDAHRFLILQVLALAGS